MSSGVYQRMCAFYCLVRTYTIPTRFDEVEDISQTNASGEISEVAVVAEGEERTTWFVWLLVLCTSISGLLFGKPRDPTESEVVLSIALQVMTPGWSLGLLSQSDPT